MNRKQGEKGFDFVLDTYYNMGETSSLSETIRISTHSKT